MRYFVTGASGFIGTAVVAELQNRGHEAVGLARSDESAAKLEAAGVAVVRGDLFDTDALHAAATNADGVIHLAYIHDFSALDQSAKADMGAIETFIDALDGTGKPLVIASGALGIRTDGELATEDIRPPAQGPGSHRIQAAELTLGAADRGVRSSIVRLAPSVHGAEDHGFIAVIAGVARDRGVAGYPGDGTNRWPAVHRSDAATLFVLAAESAPAGSVLHGIADEGVTSRAIAEAIGAGLGVPAASIPAADLDEHFGWIGRFFSFDAPTSNAATRELLGWNPTGPTLLEDLKAGLYTGAVV